MCGRFTLKTPPAEWGQLLLPLLDISSFAPTWQPRYNIAPTQNIAGIVLTDKSVPELRMFRWGLVPFWADDVAIGNGMINARAETIAEKPAFRAALAKRRCIVVADGYYEWQQLESGKQPYWIHAPDEQPFAFAGLWETNRKATNHDVISATIITTSASDSLAPLHNRMPAILNIDQIATWLDPKLAAADAAAMVQPPNTRQFVAQAVSSIVNSPRNENESCIAPK